MKKNQNIHFRRYILNNLGLNATNERVKKLINSYNKYPNDMPQYWEKAEKIKLLNDERKRLTNRAKALPADEKRNQRIKNIKNGNDIKRLDENITRGYVDIIRREISNMTLQSGLKFNLNLGKVTTVKEAEQVRERLMNAIGRKKNIDMMKLKIIQPCLSKTRP